jgi:hypothetical protein
LPPLVFTARDLVPVQFDARRTPSIDRAEALLRRRLGATPVPFPTIRRWAIAESIGLTSLHRARVRMGAEATRQGWRFQPVEEHSRVATG